MRISDWSSDVCSSDLIQAICWSRSPADMARPLSMDLRERVVARRRAGESIRAVASVFEIAPSTVSKWTQRWHETGDVKPAKFGGYRRRLLEPYRETVHALVAEQPPCRVKELPVDRAARGKKGTQ